jgi:hypothetical protein
VQYRVQTLKEYSNYFPCRSAHQPLRLFIFRDEGEHTIRENAYATQFFHAVNIGHGEIAKPTQQFRLSMNPALATYFEDRKPRQLTEAGFSVVRSEAALRYLPLFDHLSLSQPQKLQLIADLLTVIDHALDASLAEASEAQLPRNPKS